jgi:type II secretory pathway pseudopilin PulG
MNKRGQISQLNKKFKNKFSQKKKAQIWVETVIYTLIGLTIIGILIAVSKPQLEKQQDKALIEQAINGLGKIDGKIYEVLEGTGNKRKVELKIGKGVLTIDGEKDKVIWELDSKYEYSEEGVTIPAGKNNITTLPGSPWKIKIELNSQFDIKYNNKDIVKNLGQSSTPHVITIENKGTPNGKTVINFDEI